MDIVKPLVNNCDGTNTDAEYEKRERVVNFVNTVMEFALASARLTMETDGTNDDKIALQQLLTEWADNL